MSTSEEVKGASNTVEKIADSVRSTTHMLHCYNFLTKRPSQADVAEIKVVKGSEAYNEALIKEAPQLWNATTWKLFGCLILGCFAQTMVSHP